MKNDLVTENNGKDEIIIKFNDKLDKSKAIYDEYIEKVEEKFKQSITETEALRETLNRKDEDLAKSMGLLESMSTKMNDLATDNQTIYQK